MNIKALEKMKEHCAGKDSPWFTKRDVMKVAGLDEQDARVAVKTWKAQGWCIQTKRSQWYCFSPSVMEGSLSVLAAGAAASDYLRLRQREDSFMRRILPAMGIPKHMMDVQGPGQ